MGRLYAFGLVSIDYCGCHNILFWESYTQSFARHPARTQNHPRSWPKVESNITNKASQYYANITLKSAAQPELVKLAMRSINNVCIYK